MTKAGAYIEMLIVYVIIVFIVSLSSAIVALGGSNIPLKMALTLLIPVLMAAVPLIVCKIRKIRLSDLGYTAKKFFRQLIISICIFAVTFSLVILIPLLVGMNKADVLSFKCSSPGILIFFIIHDFLFIGFTEEFIFRGYFYSRIEKAAGSKLIAVVASSLLFGFWHFPNGFNIMKVAVTSIIGLIYGFARYKIRDCSVYSLSVAHGLHDMAITVFSYFIL
jgi:membrane protease YdiL (CAAX protease family)